MKRLFTLCGLFATVVALAAPASSMATMTPTGEHFYIMQEGGVGPRLVTPFGSCGVRIEGEIKSTPQFQIPHPSSTGCTNFGSMSFYPLNWEAQTSMAPPYVAFISPKLAPNEATITLKFGLTTCTMTGQLALAGKWANGRLQPRVESTFTAGLSGYNLTAKCGQSTVPVQFEGPAVNVTHGSIGTPVFVTNP